MSTTKTKVQTTLRTDGEIARNIKRSMKADFEVPEDRIAVKVVEGFVTIEGIVTRDAQKDAAEVCAKQVQGVRGITNKIIVEPAESPIEA
jgi:osmotically-inducible protein OsmY